MLAANDKNADSFRTKLLESKANSFPEWYYNESLVSYRTRNTWPDYAVRMLNDLK
jgi:hypothetical protein